MLNTMMNKQNMLRGMLLIVGLIVISLSVFYLYNYLDTSYGNDIYETFVAYQAYHNGEPIADTSNTTNPNPLSPIKSNKYYLVNIQKATSNNLAMYAIDTNTTIYYYTPMSNQWTSVKITVNNPSITNPKFANKITCNKSDSILLSASTSTLWYCNSSTDNINNIDCIYYVSLNSDGSIKPESILNCLARPLIDQTIPTTTSSGTTTTKSPTTTEPSQFYDEIKFIAANQNVLFALGCNTTATPTNPNNSILYYCALTNGIPSSNNATNWSYFNLPAGIYQSDIKQILVNDSHLFIYTTNYVTDSSGKTTFTSYIYYKPIKIQNNIIGSEPWVQFISYGKQPVSNAPFNTLTVNNDVIWCFDNNALLWWCPLKNGTEAPQTDITYQWKSINMRDPKAPLTMNSVLNLVLYSNMLVILNNTTTTNGYINLYGSFTPKPSGTYVYSYNTQYVPTNTGTTTTNPSVTGTTPSGTTTTPTGTGTTTTTPTGTGTTTTTPTGTSTTPTGTGTTTTTPTGTSTTPTGTTTTPTGTGTTTTTPTGTGTTTTKPSGSTTTTKPSTSYLNGNMNPPVYMNDSLNDLLSKNTVLGNNLYISPMNNQSLYVPPPTTAELKGKVSSYFFPMVKMY
uniref:Uncharacterized protein n=1 Tax=viral metagenome TaxID=1070528 RepID=A0A6C0EYD1_9ZZZZ